MAKEFFAGPVDTPMINESRIVCSLWDPVVDQRSSVNVIIFPERRLAELVIIVQTQIARILNPEVVELCQNCSSKHSIIEYCDTETRLVTQVVLCWIAIIQ